MKKLLYLSIVLLVFLTAACAKTSANPPQVSDNEVVRSITPPPTEAPNIPVTTEEPAPVESDAPEYIDDFDDLEAHPTIDPDSHLQFELDSRGLEFTLTDDEQEVFERFKDSLDINELKDVDPVSLAKIYIQCGIDGLWEAEYAMFAEKGLTLTKRQYQESHVRDIVAFDISSRKPYADVVFPHLKDGVFSETGDGLGEIVFLQFNGEEAKFYLIKNDDGIWLIKFDPFVGWDQE